MTVELYQLTLLLVTLILCQGHSIVFLWFIYSPLLPPPPPPPNKKREKKPALFKSIYCTSTSQSSLTLIPGGGGGGGGGGFFSSFFFALPVQALTKLLIFSSSLEMDHWFSLLVFPWNGSLIFSSHLLLKWINDFLFSSSLQMDIWFSHLFLQIHSHISRQIDIEEQKGPWTPGPQSYVAMLDHRTMVKMAPHQFRLQCVVLNSTSIALLTFFEVIALNWGAPA